MIFIMSIKKFYELTLSTNKYLENQLTKIKSWNMWPTDEIVTYLQKEKKKLLVNKFEFILSLNINIEYRRVIYNNYS